MEPHDSSANSDKLVLLHKEKNLARIILNRPDKLNALSLAMMDEFGSVLKAIARDDEISVVIISGAGKAFSVGADLEFVHGLGTAEKFRKDLIEYWHRHYDAIENMEKLFIAALNGLTIGGALEMALVCDIRLAASNIRLAMPQIKYGLIPDSGGTNRLARLVGRSATKELILSGNPIDSDEALRIGLVDRLFPSEDFMHHVDDYAARFLDNSAAAIGLGKIAVNRAHELSTRAGLEDAMYLQSVLLNSDGYKQALAEFERGHKTPRA